MAEGLLLADRDDENVKFEHLQKRIERLEGVLPSLKVTDSDQVKVEGDSDSNARDFLNSLHKRYKGSLTMHGLNHILDGTAVEKIIWSVKLVLAVTIALFLSWNLFVSYFNYEISTLYKVKNNSSMTLPVILLCAQNYHVLYSYKQPLHYHKFCEENSTSLGRRGVLKVSITCPEKLFQQCIAINLDGKAKQTSRGMRYTKDEISFPFRLYMFPQDTPFKHNYFYWERIERPGYYNFEISLKMFQRQPYPYSNPSCIKQNSPEAAQKNMFEGKYSIESCEHTCDAKLDLQCGGMKNYYRFQVKKSFHFQANNTNKTSILRCVKHLHVSRSKTKKCKEACYPPCLEESHHVTKNYYQTNIKNNISMRFAFKALKETWIIEEPKYDFPTLMSNVGGALGLMVGMSALSIMELLICFTLYIIKRTCRLLKPIQ